MKKEVQQLEFLNQKSPKIFFEECDDRDLNPSQKRYLYLSFVYPCIYLCIYHKEVLEVSIKPHSLLLPPLFSLHLDENQQQLTPFLKKMKIWNYNIYYENHKEKKEEGPKREKERIGGRERKRDRERGGGSWILYDVRF